MTECELVSARAWGEKLINGEGVLLWSNGNVWELEKGGGCTIREWTKFH